MGAGAMTDTRRGEQRGTAVRVFQKRRRKGTREDTLIGQFLIVTGNRGQKTPLG